MIVFVWFLFCINPISLILLQVAGDRCGTGQSLFGQRKLPWAVLLHREASEVLSDWCSSGGELGRLLPHAAPHICFTSRGSGSLTPVCWPSFLPWLGCDCGSHEMADKPHFVADLRK